MVAAPCRCSGRVGFARWGLEAASRWCQGLDVGLSQPCMEGLYSLLAPSRAPAGCSQYASVSSFFIVVN